MVYARDLWVQLPVKDLYDSLIMMASINAARDMYLRGVDDFKEFKKQYGDFYSPIQKDMDWYNRNVVGGATDLINNMYENGIDPLRSAEGRAMLSKFINNVPTGKINNLKASAVSALKYLDSVQDLKAKGLYNEDYERDVNPYDLQNWDTVNNGVWGIQSASPYKNLLQFVHPTFEGIKPHILTKEEVESRGMKYDPRYEYTGISEKDMRDSLENLMPGLYGDPLYNFHRKLAEIQLKNSGIANPTEDQINKRFIDNAIIADHQVATPLAREADKYTLLDNEFRNKKELEKLKSALDFANAARLDAIRTANDIRAYNSKKASDMLYDQTIYSPDQDIFRDARDNGKSYVGYETKNSYNLKIDPVKPGILTTASKDGSIIYKIPESEVRGSLLSHHNLYHGGKRVYVTPKNIKNLSFVPTGQLHAVNHGKNNIKYYISGYVFNGIPTEKVDKNGNAYNTLTQKLQKGVYMMEVKERPSSYKNLTSKKEQYAKHTTKRGHSTVTTKATSK